MGGSFESQTQKLTVFIGGSSSSSEQISESERLEILFFELRFFLLHLFENKNRYFIIHCRK